MHRVRLAAAYRVADDGALTAVRLENRDDFLQVNSCLAWLGIGLHLTLHEHAYLVFNCKSVGHFSYTDRNIF